MYMTYLRTNLDVPSSGSFTVLVIAIKGKTENTFTRSPSCYVTYYETIFFIKVDCFSQGILHIPIYITEVSESGIFFISRIRMIARFLLSVLGI